jgi:hydrogenase/urease accessory protein HupE
VAGGYVSGREIVRASCPVVVAGSVGLVVWPSGVEAHLVTTGLGPVYDGLSHFALTPEDLVPALALALLAGLRGATHGRRVLFVLPAAWLLGGILGLAMSGRVSPVLTAISFVLLGGLVAADVRLPLGSTTVLAALLGVVHGHLNGAALVSPGPGVPGLVGVVAAVFALVALAASLVVPLRAAWARVAVRVAGSWIAAIGLLLLGWAFRAGA